MGLSQTGNLWGNSHSVGHQADVLTRMTVGNLAAGHEGGGRSPAQKLATWFWSIAAIHF